MRNKTLAPYILFFIQPAVALFLTFKNYKASWAPNIVWLFTAFYGLTFAIEKDATGDSVRYKSKLEAMHSSDITFELLLSILREEGSIFLDLYQPFATFFVSRFTDDYRVLFALFGIVLGYFYSRNIWFLLKHVRYRINNNALILLLVFAFTVGISMGINGVRFWTATHIFIFGLLSIQLRENKSGLFFILATPLVHFSFTLAAFLYLIYYYVRFDTRLLFVGFVLSLFISEVDFQLVRNVISYLPSTFQEQSTGYVGERTEQKIMENIDSPVKKTWFIIYSSNAIKYSYILIVFVVYSLRKKLITSNNLARMFSFVLFFGAIFNVLSNLPSVGRFLRLPHMIVFAMAFIIVATTSNKIFKRVLLLLTPGLLLFIVVEIRVFAEWGSYLLLISNPLLSLFVESDQGLYSLLKSFL